MNLGWQCVGCASAEASRCICAIPGTHFRLCCCPRGALAMIRGRNPDSGLKRAMRLLRRNLLPKDRFGRRGQDPNVQFPPAYGVLKHTGAERCRQPDEIIGGLRALMDFQAKRVRTTRASSVRCLWTAGRVAYSFRETPPPNAGPGHTVWALTTCHAVRTTLPRFLPVST